MLGIVAAADARSQFSRLLREVEEGAELTLTRWGKPVAKLIPVPRVVERDLAKIDAAIARIKERRIGRRLDGLDWHEPRDERPR